MKYWALKFATDAAVTVLRVDQVRKKAHSTSGFIITSLSPVMLFFPGLPEEMDDIPN